MSDEPASLTDLIADYWAQRAKATLAEIRVAQLEAEVRRLETELASLRLEAAKARVDDIKGLARREACDLCGG